MTSTPAQRDQAILSSSESGEQAAKVLTMPLAMAQRVLPVSSTPVFLGASALALAGLIEWPIAGAVGLGYLALRGWRPAR